MNTVTLKESKFKDTFCLKHRIAVYIPSTINVNEKIDNSEQVKRIASNLSDLNGGATINRVSGAYLSDNDGLILEDVTIVYSNCEAITKDLLNTIFDIAENLKSELTQESIAIEIDSELYLV